jgi:hypothetical protein
MQYFCCMQTRSTAAKEAADNKPPLLAVATKLLKGDEELRRIFGSSVIAEEAREARQGALCSCCSMCGSVKQSGVVAPAAMTKPDM